jgi:TPR repeat protein
MDHPTHRLSIFTPIRVCQEQAGAAFFYATLLVLTLQLCVGAEPQVNKRNFLHTFRRAQSGHIRDQFALGRAYAEGKGVSQDYVQAMLWFRRAADQGNPGAMTEVGRMYAQGLGVTQDPQEALRWFLRAAADGYAPAQTNVGILYFSGIGVKQDISAGIAWLLKAEAKGEPSAKVSLGLAYLSGVGVEKNERRAIGLFQKAAKQSLPAAQYFLGHCHEHGIVFKTDSTEAVRWYEMASAQAYAPAKTELGLMYREGRGVLKDRAQARALLTAAGQIGDPKAFVALATMSQDGEDGVDLISAYAWLELASANGEPVRRDEQELAKVLTPEKITEAKRRASRWLQEHRPGSGTGLGMVSIDSMIPSTSSDVVQAVSNY